MDFRRWLVLGVSLLLFAGLTFAIPTQSAAETSFAPTSQRNLGVSADRISSPLGVGMPLPVFSNPCASFCLTSKGVSAQSEFIGVSRSSSLTREELDVVLNSFRVFDFSSRKWTTKRLSVEQKANAYSSWERKNTLRSSRSDLFFSPNFEKVKGAKIVFD